MNDKAKLQTSLSGDIVKDVVLESLPDNTLDVLIPSYEGDKNYPVDVKLYNVSDRGWDGSDYYGTNHFVGLDYSSSYTFGVGGQKDMVGLFSIFGSGSGLIVGYMRGYGLTLYSTEMIASTGINLGVGGMRLNGRFINNDVNIYDGTIYNPESFAGLSVTLSAGVSIVSGSRWEGYDDGGIKVWEGTGRGAALGALNVGVTLELSKTVLLHPLKKKADE